MVQKAAAETLDYVKLTPDQSLKKLDVNLADGLPPETVLQRRQQAGPNEIGSHETKWWQILARQFRSPFIYLLLGAVVISWFLGELTDTLMIALFIIVNAGIGFYQEFKSDHSLKLLRSYIKSFVVVRRQGKETRLEIVDLVPGDIVLLEAGDRVPADLKIIEAESLTVDESALTGESITVAKSNQVQAAVTELFEAMNLLWAGTILISGRATGLVIASGRESAFGKIAQLTTATVKESELSKGLDKFSKFILRLVALTIVFIVVANLLIKPGGTSFGDLLVFAIALAVAVIPEALPVVSVFSLSRGALQLARKKVIVKRLSAVEDLGGIEILCTDKTGTITENALTVVDSLVVNHERPLIFYANLAAGQRPGQAKLDPFDKALEQALKVGEPKLLTRYDFLSEAPFDPLRRRNSLLVGRQGRLELVVRGAPEDILAVCRKTKAAASGRDWCVQQGLLGRRVLAVAVKTLARRPKDLAPAEENLELLGFISFEDPIKPTTRGAIDQARRLGLAIKILTGDAAEVAGAVAQKIGLISDARLVMTGSQLMALGAAEQRAAVLKEAVFARVTPVQKHHIVTLLQEVRSVGFLGEGINDAPALKVADVSLVVESAADISREAADIILMQKSLQVIVNGIKDGREVFANTLKYIKATLSSNFGNFYAVAIGSLFITFLPLLPVQILLINMLSDFPMIAIAADNVDPEEIANPRTYRVRDIALLATFLGIVSTIFDFIFFALYFRSEPAVLQTNWFIASVVTELVFLFSVRTNRPFWKSRRPASLITSLTVAALVMTLIIPFTAWGQAIFHFQRPQTAHLLVILELTAVYFVATEVVKQLYHRFLVAKVAGRS